MINLENFVFEHRFLIKKVEEGKFLPLINFEKTFKTP
jgi:hypothetical protein